MMRLQRYGLLLVFLLFASSAFARPSFLEDFRRDPFRRPEIDGCNTCHMSAQGGDARNAFGQAFESSGMRITAMLRAQFPDRFAYPISRGASDLAFYFSDPAGKQVVVERSGTRMLVDLGGKAVDGVPAGAAATNTATAAAGAASTTTTKKQESVDAFAHEGAFFGMYIVNLPNGKPIKAGGVDVVFQHRFVEDIQSAGAGGLYGLDSPAVVMFGAQVGITNRLSGGIFRTNLDKTIEINSTLNISRQNSTGTPLTFMVRGGVEGRQNFGESYSPYIQPVFTRQMAPRLSMTLAPTFAFNTRDENSNVPPESRYGAEHNHTISLGVGAGIRVLNSTSIVGEYIPRLWGFQGERKDRPGVSMGLQKATNRHTFELVVSRQLATTTSQYAVQGTDTFNIGFNIYRRVR
jgi:hypothetical protein